MNHKSILTETKNQEQSDIAAEQGKPVQSGLIQDVEISQRSIGTTPVSDNEQNSAGTHGSGVDAVAAVGGEAGVGGEGAVGRETVDGVGGVGGQLAAPQKSRRPRHLWIKGRDAAENLRRLGKKLRKCCNRLFRNGDQGPGLKLILPDGTSKLIQNGKELAPIVIDTIRLIIEDDTGKRAGDFLSNSIFDTGLGTRSFLDEFPPLDRVVTRPFYRADYTLSPPGYDQEARMFYFGGVPEISSSIDTINRFLDQVDFLEEADRTNCLGAAILCLLHEFWPGVKPMVRILANKSHAGKGTVMIFITGDAPAAILSIGEADWAIETKFQSQLEKNPAIGVIKIDNARNDSIGGGGKKFRSAFFEGLITDDIITLATPKGRTPIVVPNRFVVLINSNDGLFSPDLLNRSLTIRLDTKGDIQSRPSPLGNLRHDFLPKALPLIAAELRGGIDGWRQAGCPVDESIRHPMGPCMKVLGGIVKYMGFNGFNANYSEAKTSDDPIRAAIAILASDDIGTAKTPREWARCAVRLGVHQELLPRKALGNIIAMEREMGRLMTAHIEETFHCSGEEKKQRVRLTGGYRHWENGKNSNRYVFELCDEGGSKIVVPLQKQGQEEEENPEKLPQLSDLSVPEIPLPPRTIKRKPR